MSSDGSWALVSSNILSSVASVQQSGSSEEFSVTTESRVLELSSLSYPPVCHILQFALML